MKALLHTKVIKTADSDTFIADQAPEVSIIRVVSAHVFRCKDLPIRYG